MHLRYKKILTYLVVFASTLLLAWILPNRHLPMWQWWLEAIVYSGLFALLVWLSCRLVRSGRGAGETAITALFLLFFLPRGGGLVNLSIESVTYLASQCMVPFFIGQYMRIRRRDYGHIYVLMILMGIFCSYTHDAMDVLAHPRGVLQACLLAHGYRLLHRHGSVLVASAEHRADSVSLWT